MHGCVFSTVATDVLMLKQQAISAHRDKKIFIPIMNICLLIILCRWEVSHHNKTPGIILGMGSANESRRYYVTPSLIGQAHTQNDPRSDTKLSYRCTTVNYQRHSGHHGRLLDNPVRLAMYPGNMKPVSYILLWKDITCQVWGLPIIGNILLYIWNITIHIV